MTQRPLAGANVAVLRVGDGDGRLEAALRDAGATAAAVTVGRVTDRSDEELLREVGDVGNFAWAAVTSRNAARRLTLWASTWPASTRVAVVGPATRTAVESMGLSVAAEAPDGTAASLATQIDDGPVVFLAAATARSDLVEQLTARGIVVHVVVAYDVTPAALDGDDARSVARADVVVAMSPVAIDAVVALGGTLGTASRTVAIGPTTAARAAETGLGLAAVAQRRDPAAVLDAIDAAMTTR